MKTTFIDDDFACFTIDEATTKEFINLEKLIFSRVSCNRFGYSDGLGIKKSFAYQAHGTLVFI